MASSITLLTAPSGAAQGLFVHCRPAPGALLGLLMLLVLSGCRTSADPEEPAVMGTPPEEAFLGVDYRYNFGATGGDDLLAYSLSNAPPWLALENTRNKARKGIVLRGQPGITGGRREEKDLGNHPDIRITSNDGKLVGDKSFSIRVRHNPLKVQDARIEEGASFSPDLDGEAGQAHVCELPDMDERHPVEVTHRRLATGEGDFQADVKRSYEASPVLLEVRLEKPSVEPVVVEFELKDNFQPDFDGTTGSTDCPANTTEEDIPCEYRSRNQSRAIYGEDFVLSSGRFSDPPDYLKYLDSDGRRGRGLLTFEPGVTRCFVRAEVFNDTLAEDVEGFTLELLEVRQGLASLTENNASARGRFDILDNSPELSLSPATVTQSRGETREYSAHLSDPNPMDEPLLAWIVHEPDESGAGSEDFSLIHEGQQGERVLLRFPPGSDEVRFGLRLQENGAVREPRQLDDLLRIEADVRNQFGREFFVSGQQARSDVFINEWTRSLVVNDFIPGSIVAGAFGELYLAGLSGDNSRLNLWSVNRLGDTDTQAEDTERLIDQLELGGRGYSPQLSFAESDRGTSGSPRLRRDLVLGLSTEGPFAGEEGTGDLDFGLVFYRSLVGDTAEDDSVSAREPFPDMQEFWRLRTGSGGDDFLEQVMMQSTGRILVGGITQGDWVDPASGEQERHQGQGDLLLSAFDTIQEDENQFRGERVWTRLVGSAGTETFAGIGETVRNEPRMLGSTLGEVVSGDSLGGEDFVFASTSLNGNLGRALQFGTQEPDRFAGALMSSRTLWGVGASQVDYREDPEERIPRLLRSPGLRDSTNPFVFAANQLGNMEAVLVLESADSLSSQTVSAVAASGADLFVAGETDGSFVQGASGRGAYLFMVARDESVRAGDEEPMLSEKWRIQIPSVARVLDLSIHDDRKLFLLAEMDSGDYQVRLYNRLGELLTE